MTTLPDRTTPDANYFSLDSFTTQTPSFATSSAGLSPSNNSSSMDVGFTDVNGRNLMVAREQLNQITQDENIAKVQQHPAGRQYPLVEHRSFRDVSSALEIDEPAGGENNGSTNLRTRSSPAPAGAIGDRRKPTIIPDEDPAPLSGKTESSSSTFNMQQPISATNVLLPTFDLSDRLTSLESTVSGLSNLIHTEVRALHEEIGVLRGLVLQSTSIASALMPQRASNQTGNGRESSEEMRLGGGSPLLTLQAPSPTVAHFNFSPRSAQSHQKSFLGAPLSIQSLHSNPDRTSVEERARLVSLDKDEQIRSLTAQLSSISASVAHLIGTPAMSPNLSPNLSRRQVSPAVSPNIGSLAEAWNPAVSPVIGTTGSSFGGQGRGSMIMRPTSSGSGRTGGGGASTFPTFPRSETDRRSVLSFNTIDGANKRDTTGTFDSSTSNQWDSASTLSSLVSPLIGANSPGSLGGKWEALGVGSDLFRTIVKYGLGPPTKIQIKAVPCVLSHQDVVAQAPSIQERIQSYVVPALQIIYTAANSNLSDGLPQLHRGIQVLIITATVDQSAQAQRLSVGLGGSLGIRTSLCVGQGDLQNELTTLMKSPPHVLVGTPQRLLELFSMRTLSTADVRLLIIDECDQLIARNLSDYVQSLVRILPPSNIGVINPTGSPISTRSIGARSFNESFGGASAATTRQTAIYSCTVPQDVLNFASSLQLREPVRVLVRREGGEGVKGEGVNPSLRGLKQYFVYIAMGANNTTGAGGSSRREAANSAREWKLEALADLVEDIDFATAIIFCASVDTVEAVTFKLGSRAVEALALHQDMGQSARHAIMMKFRSTLPNTRTGGSKRCLVVYDALAKTVSDAHTVPLVINYDLTRSPEDYIHRISCAIATGYGRPGVAINIVTPGADVDMLRSIESFYRCKILEFPASFAT